MKFISIFIMTLFYTFHSHASNLVFHLQPHQEYDPQNQYFIDLLQLALENSVDEFGQYKMKPVELSMYQERQLKSLDTGMLSVLWTAYKPEREKNAIAVKFPLLDGLLGKRVFVILRHNQEQFSSIESLSGLKDLVALQGHDWPDTQILQHNGLKVKTTNWYNRMYNLVSEGFVDYFPRGVLEASQELLKQQDESLVIEQKHLLVYPMYMYFFVGKSDQRLANRLLYGLRESKKNGSYDKLLYESPSHSVALSAINMKGRKVHYLKLPAEHK